MLIDNLLCVLICEASVRNCCPFLNSGCVFYLWAVGPSQCDSVVLELFIYFRYKFLVSECVPQWLLSRVPLFFKTFQGFLSHLGINFKSLSQPTRSMRNDLLYQVHLISCGFSPYSLYSHCQHATPAPASGPLHGFTHWKGLLLKSSRLTPSFHPALY